MFTQTIIQFVCCSLFLVVSAYANQDSVLIQGEQVPPEIGVTASSPNAAEATPASGLESRTAETQVAAETVYNWRRDTHAQTSVILSEHPAEPPKTAAIAPEKVIPWGQMPKKDYLIPALEIPGFLVLLNIYDRYAYPNQMQDGKGYTVRLFPRHGITCENKTGSLTRTLSTSINSLTPIRERPCTDWRVPPA